MDKLQIYQTKRTIPNQPTGLIFKIRPDTTDIKAIKEVVEQNGYQKPRKGFSFSLSNNWLDLGANIGSFAMWVLSHPNVESVISVEPEPENIKITWLNYHLNKNSFVDENNNDKFFGLLPVVALHKNHPDLNTGQTKLFLSKGKRNKYRHTTVKSLNKKGDRQSIDVNTTTLEDILETFPQIDGIKMDIEGSEIEILEQIDLNLLKNVKALVFEYTFDADPSIPRFLKIVEKLSNSFDNVNYTKVKSDELEYKYFPPCTNVYMWN